MKKETGQHATQIGLGAKIMFLAAALLLISYAGILWAHRPDKPQEQEAVYSETAGDQFGTESGQIPRYDAAATAGTTNQTSAPKPEQAAEILPPGTETAVDQPTQTPAPDPSEEPTEDSTIRDSGELQGNIYITDNAGYGLYYFSLDGADAFAQAMNQFYRNVGDKVNIYAMIVPISAGVMLDQPVLDDMGTSDEAKALDYLYSQMDPGIHTVSVFDNLKQHNAEYIYFHTDHHWTALGAYYAYEIFCQEKGLTPHRLEDYETMVFENFKGTFYTTANQASALGANPDTITAYIPKGTNEMRMEQSNGNQYDWRIVNDVSDYPESELYSAFAGGDNPWSYAHNETISDGSSVVVIKDSYGNAFIPWLVDHYEHIYWIDIRYTRNTISEMVEDYGIQDVIVVLNIYNGTTDGVVDRLAAIGQ